MESDSQETVKALFQNGLLGEEFRKTDGEIKEAMDVSLVSFDNSGNKEAIMLADMREGLNKNSNVYKRRKQAVSQLLLDSN